MKETSMQYRLDQAGIRTIRTDLVYLEKDGKRIVRPQVCNCETTVKRIFNVDI